MTSPTRTGRLARFITVIMSALLVVGITASAATAFSPGAVAARSPHAANVGAAVPMDIMKEAGDFLAASRPTSNVLPIDRWMEGTSQFITRQAGGLSFDILDKSRRDMVAGTAISAGNMLWSLASSMTSFAMKLSPLGKGGQGANVDKVIGDLGRATIDNPGGSMPPFLPLILAIVIASVGSLVYRTMKTGGSLPIGKIVTTLVVLGLLVVMTRGAVRSNPQTGEPGKGSPTWVVSKVEEVMTKFGTAPAALIALDAHKGPKTSDIMSCDYYVSKLKQYRTMGQETPSTEVALPLIVNQLWENTGLEAWKNAQFGADNKYAANTYCRALDFLSVTPVTQGQIAGKSEALGLYPVESAMTYGGWNGPTFHPRGTAFNDRGDSAVTEMSMVAWATCMWQDGAWKFRPGTENLLNKSFDKDYDAKDMCGQWWERESTTSYANNYNPVGEKDGEGVLRFHITNSAFNWKTDLPYIYDEIKSDDAAVDFLLNLRAKNASGSNAVAFAYLFSSIVIFFTFAAFAVAIILAKIMLLFMGLALFFVAIASLMPHVNAGEKLVGILKRTVGLAALGLFAMFLFSIMGTLTKIISDVGYSQVPRGSTLGMCIAALSPVGAVAALYFFFKAAHLPSPFTINGLKQWSSGAAIMGGAAGGFAGSLMGSSGARRLMNSATNAITGGRLSTKSKTGPKEVADHLVGKTPIGKNKHAATKDEAINKATDPNAPKLKGKDRDKAILDALGLSGASVDEQTQALYNHKTASRQLAKDNRRKDLLANHPDSVRAAFIKARTDGNGLGKSLRSSSWVATKNAWHSSVDGVRNAVHHPLKTLGKPAAIAAGAMAFGTVAAIPAAAYMANKARYSSLADHMHNGPSNAYKRLTGQDEYTLAASDSILKAKGAVPGEGEKAADSGGGEASNVTEAEKDTHPQQDPTIGSGNATTPPSPSVGDQTSPALQRDLDSDVPSPSTPFDNPVSLGVDGNLSPHTRTGAEGGKQPR